MPSLYYRIIDRLVVDGLELIRSIQDRHEVANLLQRVCLSESFELYYQ
jgi:hypothetical protein